MRSQPSAPEELPGRRGEKGKLENQEAALGSCWALGCGSSSPCHSPSAVPPSSPLGSFPGAHQLTGKTEAELHGKTENGEEAPPKQCPGQTNSSLPPPWAVNIGGAMTWPPRLLLRKERPLWCPHTSLGLTAVSWCPLCWRGSQAAGNGRQGREGA